jgi:hypothetical protein
MKSGIELIRDEREKQIVKHGYTVQNDVETTTTGELIKAAESYIESSEGFDGLGLDHWPWNKMYYKPESMKRDLIKAGALIAAAIDRLNTEWLQNGPRLNYSKIVLSKNLIFYPSTLKGTDRKVVLYEVGVYMFLNGSPCMVFHGPIATTKWDAICSAKAHFKEIKEKHSLPQMSDDEFRAIENLINREWSYRANKRYSKSNDKHQTNKEE